MPLEFEWDSAKATANLRKHRVSFNEAATVFADVLASTVVDRAHSLAEERLVIFGISERSRVLAVMFTNADRASASSAHAKPLALSAKPMKPEPSEQQPGSPPSRDPDEILPEYDPALIRSGERGRYADRYAQGTTLVALDADVAAAFPDAAEVNAVLRAVAAIIRSHQSET